MRLFTALLEPSIRADEIRDLYRRRWDEETPSTKSRRTWEMRPPSTAL